MRIRAPKLTPDGKDRWCIPLSSSVLPLPIDYQQVEYIASSGAQYIDLNYICKKNNIIIELDMMWTGATVGAFETFIGFMYSPSVVTPRIGLHKWSSQLMFGANATTASGVTPPSNTRFTYRGEFISGAQKMYVNGVLKTSNATTFDFTSNTCPTYMFARYCPGSMNYATMRMYSCKIWEGDSLVKHIIPCYKKSSGAIGAYDIIKQEFYTNSGTGNLAKGGDVFGHLVSGSIRTPSLPVTYQRVEYIQSNGAQKIQLLNIVPNSKYKIEEEFAITDKTVTSCLWCARGTATTTYTTTAFNLANSQLRCDYGASAVMTNVGSLTVNQKYKLTMDAEKWYLDNVLKVTNTVQTFTAGGPLTLFYSYYNGVNNNSGNYAKMKLYSFKVWSDTNALLVNLIPCYKKDSGEIGLYNIMDDTFYTNVGSGSFTVT